MNADRYYLVTKDREDVYSNLIRCNHSYDSINQYFKTKSNLINLGFFESIIIRGYARKGEYYTK